jgi:Family of unknown function (DUF6221)
MTPADELVAFVTRCLDEDEQWALAANQVYPYAVDDPSPPETGVHWTWVTGENWTPTTPDPVTEEFVGDTTEEWNVNLATVEQWSIGNYGIEGVPERFMPQTYANSIVEMDASAAGHIARWDPHRVLAKVKADRAILDEIEEHWDDADPIGGRGSMFLPAAWEKVLRLLAQPYDDHPGWQEEWRSTQ